MTRTKLEQGQLVTLEDHLEHARGAFAIYLTSKTLPDIGYALDVYEAFKKSVGRVLGDEDERFMEDVPTGRGDPLDYLLLEYSIAVGYLQAAEMRLEESQATHTSTNWTIDDLRLAIKGEGGGSQWGFTHIIPIAKEITYFGGEVAVMGELEKIQKEYQSLRKQV